MDDSALAKVQSPTNKKGKTKMQDSGSTVLKDHMEKSKLEQLTKMYLLESED